MVATQVSGPDAGREEPIKRWIHTRYLPIAGITYERRCSLTIISQGQVYGDGKQNGRPFLFRIAVLVRAYY